MTDDKLRDALQEIANWAQAYPADVFTDVTDAEMNAASEAVARISPNMLTRLHARWARHLLQGIGDIARKALAP